MSSASSRRRAKAQRRAQTVKTVPTVAKVRPPKPEPSAWQAQALLDLDTVLSDYPEFGVDVEPSFDEDGMCRFTVGVDTTGFQRSPRAKVRFQDREQFTVWIETEEAQPPYVSVDHLRFLGAAHVMSGYQVCLYRDPAREWDPADGIRGTFRRLRDWVDDTAGNKHDPNTALFHAVGGTTHITAGAPTVVVRAPLPDVARPTTAFLHARTFGDPAAAGGGAGQTSTASADVCRYDLVHDRIDDSDLVIPVVPLRGDLPIGAGDGALKELLDRIDFTQGLWSRYPHDKAHDNFHETAPSITLRRHNPPIRDIVAALVHRNPLEVMTFECSWRGHDLPTLPPAYQPAFEYPEPSDSVTRLAGALIDAIAVNPHGSAQYALVAVPHPVGGPRHLICLRVPAAIADQTRTALSSGDAIVTAATLVRVSGRVPMEWCRVSDERDAVTTRRDVRRPVTELVGRIVHIWGTGGLGSWIAEWVVRAGAAKVVLSDPGRVTGGLLVRQDFSEHDIGRRKDEALASRLRDLRDDVEVELAGQIDLDAVLDADLLIDATISRTVTRGLDRMAAAFPQRRATLAKIATDTDTGTLGIAIVAVPGSSRTLTEIDDDAGAQVLADSALEGYRVFWREPNPGSEFVPTRGCSIPTFHGSAADLASVSGVLLNLICLHLASQQSGTHLMSLPHSEVSPSRQLVRSTLDATPGTTSETEVAPGLAQPVPAPRTPTLGEQATEAAR